LAIDISGDIIGDIIIDGWAGEVALEKVNHPQRLNNSTPQPNKPYLYPMELSPTTQKSLANLEIAALNAMQEAALTAIQDKDDIVLLSPTGSGKTLAFLLPVLELLSPDADGVQCLILSPTRELAIQIERVWQRMSTGYKVSTCYGGHSMQIETQRLVEPPALLIGTPGRIQEHITRETFDPKKVRMMILDEFDKSLSLGFVDQMTEIIQTLKGLQKRVLVSATTKMTIPEFTGIVNPETVRFTQRNMATNEGLLIKSVMSPTADKRETLFKLLCELGAEPALIFCNLRETTEQIKVYLKEKGMECAVFHGGLEQLDREKALIQFRNGSTLFLVASDLAARGLDIPIVQHVIHYELPSKHTDFLHRNGRTARMHAEGAAYLMLSSAEPLPVYVMDRPEPIELPEKNERPPVSLWVTLYISGGKKDKIGKVDIVGFLSQKGGITKEDLGKIEILDLMSFVAVKKSVVNHLLHQVAQEKMKGKKYKINVAW
jgi:superfamily II DNA/RNA helicase